MRQIKIGDQVQAFWDANLIGEVVDLGTVKHETLLIGGTLEQAPYCDVRLKTGKVVRVKLSDVFHVV
jgi:hypothetical protein